MNEVSAGCPFGSRDVGIPTGRRMEMPTVLPSELKIVEAPSLTPGVVESHQLLRKPVGIL